MRGDEVGGVDGSHEVAASDEVKYIGYFFAAAPMGTFMLRKGSKIKPIM